MVMSVALLEKTLLDKLIEVGRLDEEDATQVAFDVVEELEEEGFFDEDSKDEVE
jgi:hypothetical protein